MQFTVQQLIRRLQSKRTLSGMLLGVVVTVSACAVSSRDDTANLSPEDKMLRHKYRGIYGGVLRTDATGYPKQYVTMQTQSGQIWQARPQISHFVGNSTFTDSMYIPRTLHVVWRTGDVRPGRIESKNEPGSRDYTRAGFEGGTILGDYTVPLATRIPDEILDYIRQNGGALRLKIRLKDDGILIGWDVEKSLPIPNCKPGEVAICTAIHHFFPGGDFREAYREGRLLNPGWQK
jgi:hypothetical protein